MIYLICLPALFLMTFLGAAASLFLKRASSSEGIVGYLRNSSFYMGGFLYFASSVLNIIILRFLDYSIVLPLTSITYIWTMILSYFILKENITAKKAVGVFFIIVGAAVISL